MTFLIEHTIYMKAITNKRGEMTASMRVQGEVREHSRTFTI